MGKIGMGITGFDYVYMTVKYAWMSLTMGIIRYEHDDYMTTGKYG